MRLQSLPSLPNIYTTRGPNWKASGRLIEKAQKPPQQEELFSSLSLHPGGLCSRDALVNQSGSKSGCCMGTVFACRRGRPKAIRAANARATGTRRARSTGNWSGRPVWSRWWKCVTWTSRAAGTSSSPPPSLSRQAKMDASTTTITTASRPIRSW